ncbi:DNA polymerase I [Pseudogracilibacillus auburnensis]|uniref:DNA polymerase I n=1 Tax=Pseudogracilibacillus auburnensis TaxID=1494959 RepID=A0A2V3VUE7_9BACI|nr:DNA polymerase I [Pseudogracilibacillus auburnensis]MBO1004506.1 DNA polymerase I [Pseudogracilibacillus auburnensis]PXW85286.1 DNA polymerase I [Pseudogracilibacillus auburnensis]
MSKKLVLIDGNSLLFRAFYALPLLHNDKGVYTNAVYGFTNILLNILEEEKPTHMLVAFDAGKTTFRHSTFKEYKGGRQKTPPELSEQFPLTRELLKAFHIPHYELDMYEADDIIGTLANMSNKEKWDVKVISGDQDLLQLVSENVTVDVTKKGVSEVESYTPESLLEKMELTPEQIIDLKALMGDSSDNIPGVPGVGVKTATKLLKQYRTLENLYDHIDEITAKKLKEKLETYKEDAWMSRDLATINIESPITISLEDLNFEGYEYQDIYSLFSELGFRTLLDRLHGEAEEAPQMELEPFHYDIIDELSTDLFTGEEALHLEMVTENYHEAKIEAVSIVGEKGCFVIETEKAFQSDVFIQWLEDETKKKFVFDAKAMKVALLNRGVHLKGISFDLQLAAYLLNPADNNEEITAIGRRLGEKDVYLDEEVYGKGAKLAVPAFSVLSEHIARKTNIIYTLKDRFIDELKKNEQMELFKELELPLALILADIEHVGVQVDVERLKEMGVELTERLDTIEAEIHELAGEKFNTNSPKQLSVILFEKLKLPVIKKTKTGYSTAADVLERLQPEHEIIPKLLLYRQLKKLQSTYVEGLLKVVHKDTHKIHTRFNQALTQTGRLSSTEPNLQNIPIRLEEGRKIRQAFTSSQKDWLMFAADYSQIELRVLAHISGDKKLMEAFQENKDIHTQTAMDVFHVEESEVNSNMRRQAKAVNFGIVYGISDYGLSQSLQITRKEAKQFIDKYFAIYPDVKQYMEDIVQEAKHNGYVSTIMKRRRYLPEITSSNFNQRSFAERTAMNTPIQGSAADIIKKAMIDLDQRLKEEKLQARMLMQVHDELILEAPKEEMDVLAKIVPEVMEKTVQLNVPLMVDYSYGKSWFDAN